jgi:hypothetical protein
VKILSIDEKQAECVPVFMLSTSRYTPRTRRASGSF